MGATDYEAELRAVNEEVYKHSLELVRLKQELELANEQQEALIHFIGHEVKGFLAKDAGAFAALSEGDLVALPEAVKSFVDSALAQSRDGERSVTNILKAANLKKGTVAYVKEPFDLKALAEEEVEKVKPVAERKGLELSFVADESSYQMLGDKAQIGDHVLRNLLDNAINYTPSGSITVSLERARDASSDKEKIIFKVKDTGIGISEEDKKHLFTEGGHGKDSQTTNVHSTGYGLYIAKNIIEAHGGVIRAESEGAGKGATFIVEFPSVA
jgi:signal transduction histidine kinase